MPTYISLFQYTQQGVQNIKGSPARLDAARKQFEALGVKIKAFYLTMGQYDAVVISEGPDDETAAKAMLSTAMQGNVRTETLRAFTEDEFRKIVGALP
jgi:uncharacterized protein with GYD domain